MKFKIGFLILFFTLFGSSFVAAHTGLSSSAPENNQVLSTAPEQIELIFSGPVLLARIEFRDSRGERVDLDVSAYTQAAENFVVDLPDDLSAGKYTSRWTVLGEDGHTMVGALSFTIEGN